PTPPRPPAAPEPPAENSAAPPSVIPPQPLQPPVVGPQLHLPVINVRQRLVKQRVGRLVYARGNIGSRRQPVSLRLPQLLRRERIRRHHLPDPAPQHIPHLRQPPAHRRLARPHRRRHV